jgi:hypothetical protein
MSVVEGDIEMFYADARVLDISAKGYYPPFLIYEALVVPRMLL